MTSKLWVYIKECQACDNRVKVSGMPQYEQSKTKTGIYYEEKMYQTQATKLQIYVKNVFITWVFSCSSEEKKVEQSLLRTLHCIKAISMLREHHFTYQRLEDYYTHLKNEEIHSRHMKEKVAKDATRKRKKKKAYHFIRRRTTFHY